MNSEYLVTNNADGPDTGPTGEQVQTANRPRARHVLVVDDDDLVRGMLRTAFEIESWKVTEAAGGAEALKLLRWPPFPNVVLLDLMMPNVDGFTVLRELKDTPITARVPVVILSAKADALSVRLAASLGATDYVTKPFDTRTSPNDA